MSILPFAPSIVVLSLVQASLVALPRKAWLPLPARLPGPWWALVLPYAASAQPLLVLIFRGFFDQIPNELLESARTDGCTEAQVLVRIVAPLTRPVLLTGAILVTINVWGDYLWPTIVIQDPHRTTISAGVQQFVSSFGLNVSSGGSVFAAFVIATVPMLVLVGFTMRYFVSGLTEGATKLLLRCH